MTDPMTPLTEESKALLAEVHGTSMALNVFPARLRAIEQAAARRALEGSGVVEAVAGIYYRLESALGRLDGAPEQVVQDIYFTFLHAERLAERVGIIGPDPVASVLDVAQPALPRPEEPRVVGAVWCPCLLPGGWVCESCGQPVESEPCAEHMDPEGVMVYRPGVPCPDRARTPEAR